jgi:hypothetical protein
VLPLDIGAGDTFAGFAERVVTELRERWQRPTFDYLINNADFGQCRCSRTPQRNCSTSSFGSSSRAPTS